MNLKSILDKGVMFKGSIKFSTLAKWASWVKRLIKKL